MPNQGLTMKQNGRNRGIALWPLVRARVHRAGVYGLGIACEHQSITDDNVGRYWTELHAKIFIGPWLINIHLPISKINELPF